MCLCCLNTTVTENRASFSSGEIFKVVEKFVDVVSLYSFKTQLLIAIGFSLLQIVSIVAFSSPSSDESSIKKGTSNEMIIDSPILEIKDSPLSEKWGSTVKEKSKITQGSLTMKAITKFYVLAFFKKNLRPLPGCIKYI